MKSYRIAMLFIFAIIFTTSFKGKAESIGNLFSSINYEEKVVYPDPSISYLQTRIVTINEVLLGNNQIEVNCNFFNEDKFIAIIAPFGPFEDSPMKWTGSFIDFPYSELVITKHGDSFSGYFRLPDEFYRIQPLSEGKVRIIQIPIDDISILTQELLLDDQERLESLENFSTPVYEDSSNFIDVLFIYTASARAAEGGTNAIQSMIDGIIVETNVGFNNSAVNTQLRLVHSREVAYDDQWISNTNDWVTMLERLTYTSDGHLDNIHQIRDQVGADLVVLLINDDSLGGIAWVMQDVGSYFAQYAFSVVAQPYALGYFIAGHEMGHNMGCAHDIDNASVNGAFDYSYGLQVYSTFRTIMAYACPSDSYCPRVNYWSNPNISIGGTPTGISDQADNAKTINNTIPIVANFRQSVSAPQSSPSNFSASDGEFMNKIAIDWDPVLSATSYEVFKNQIETVPDQPFIISSSTTIEDTDVQQSIIYYYWVRACNQSGCSSISEYNTGEVWSPDFDLISYSSGSDFNGDFIDDPAKFYPNSGSLKWLNSSTGLWKSVWLGSDEYTLITSSDFDGDGVTDPAKFYPLTGTIWWISTRTNSWQGFWLGSDSYDYIAESDFDGDGKTDPAKFYSSTGTVWWFSSFSGSWHGFWLGADTFKYIAGSDFDGDGVTDPAKFYSSTGTVWWFSSLSDSWHGRWLGSDAFVLVTGSDFDGDGKDDPAKYFEETGFIWWINSSNGTWEGFWLGSEDYNLITGHDFNSDGKTDPAKFYSSTGFLWWFSSSERIWNPVNMIDH